MGGKNRDSRIYYLMAENSKLSRRERHGRFEILSKIAHCAGKVRLSKDIHSLF